MADKMADQSKRMTNDELKNRVRSHQRKIVSDVDPDAVSDWLLQETIVTVEQWQTIRANNSTRCSRCRALLLDLFSNSHPKTFLVLSDALKVEAPHIWQSIVSQSDGSSSAENVNASSTTSDSHQSSDLENKFHQLLLKQTSVEEICSDLKKQLDAEKERHREEKETMDRSWNAERSQLLQKQNQLERRISELEDLLQSDKRKKSDADEDEHSTSLCKPKSENIKTLSAVQASDQPPTFDTTDSVVRQAKEFFSKQGNVDTTSNQRKPRVSLPEFGEKKSTWKRNSDEEMRESKAAAKKETSHAKNETSYAKNEMSHAKNETVSHAKNEHEEQTKTKSPQPMNIGAKSPTSLLGLRSSQSLPTEHQRNDPTSPTAATPISEIDSVSYHQTIRTRCAIEENKAISGLTILDDELFVVSRLSSDVEVFDSTKLSFKRRWELIDLLAPVDIVSCKRMKCLYIMQERGGGGGQTTEIARVNRDGVVSKRWPTGQDYGHSLSVTDESNVIVCVFQQNKFIEFSPDGHLMREVRLAVESGLLHPSHALKLTTDLFLVSHGTRNDILHRVCIVDSDGRLKKSFGGKNHGSVAKGLNRPIHLSICGRDGRDVKDVKDGRDEKDEMRDGTRDGMRDVMRDGMRDGRDVKDGKDGLKCWMVVDQWNSRVLSFDSNLKFVSEILSKEKHGLRRPSRILFDDESNIGRLFVVDNEWDTTNLILIDGRILVFNQNHR